MSSESGKCRWEGCVLTAVWGSEFCFLHRPTGEYGLTSSVCVVARWAGNIAAAAVLLHFLKLLPHIGTIFNGRADLIAALANDPERETLNEAISLLARAENSVITSDVELEAEAKIIIAEDRSVGDIALREEFGTSDKLIIER